MVCIIAGPYMYHDVTIINYNWHETDIDMSWNRQNNIIVVLYNIYIICIYILFLHSFLRNQDGWPLVSLGGVSIYATHGAGTYYLNVWVIFGSIIPPKSNKLAMTNHSSIFPWLILLVTVGNYSSIFQSSMLVTVGILYLEHLDKSWEHICIRSIGLGSMGPGHDDSDGTGRVQRLCQKKHDFQSCVLGCLGLA